MRTSEILPATLATLAALVFASACGCEPGMKADTRLPPPPVSDPSILRLMTPLVPAINMDENPGPEAIRLRVFFKRFDGGKNQHRMVTVSGSLKFLMFDGKIAGESMAPVEPRHTWRFSASDLASHAFRTRLYGWGYEFVLPWGAHAPQESMVTLVAVYEAPGGGALYSAPIQITIGPL